MGVEWRAKRGRRTVKIVKILNAENSLIKAIEEVVQQQGTIDTFDSFHALFWVVALFSLELKNRPEGQLVFYC
jgi:type IV secretory pathway TrbD component